MAGWRRQESRTGRIKKGQAVGHSRNLPGYPGLWKELRRAAESINFRSDRHLGDEVGQQEASIKVPIMV